MQESCDVFLSASCNLDQDLFPPLSQKLPLELPEPSLPDAFPHPAHQIQVEKDIMDRPEPQGEHFSRIEQVPQVRPREVAAGVAGACRIDRRGSRSYCAFLMTTLPKDVKNVPFRAFRVGITQSNMSMPRSTPSTRSSGVPTPIRYRGLSSGRNGTDASIISYMTGLVSPTDSPPRA